jgi:putative ABC transport system permease protein
VTLWLTLRNLRVRALGSLLTVLAVALATATALVVPLLTSQVQRGAADAAQVFDLLITAKGSPVQAVLSSLYYLDVPIGNLPYSTYTALAADPRTRRAVPLGFGDNYQGLPVVGTGATFFDQRLSPKAPPYFRVRQGRQFAAPFEAVLGAVAASQTGLRLGQRFRGAHGLGDTPAGAEREEHAQPYLVVGVLAPTGGPVDRAVLTPLASLWAAHGQAGAQRGVTAVLYTPVSLGDLYQVARRINAEPRAQAVFPGQVFGQVMGFVNQGQAAYAGLSLLVLLLAAITVWLSIYAASLERARGVALLRALGARRATVFGVVLSETAVLVSLGLLVGLGLGVLLSVLGAQLLGTRLGFSLPAPQLGWPLLARTLWLLPLGLLAAVPPAWRAATSPPVRALTGP